MKIVAIFYNDSMSQNRTLTFRLIIFKRGDWRSVEVNSQFGLLIPDSGVKLFLVLVSPHLLKSTSLLEVLSLAEA